MPPTILPFFRFARPVLQIQQWVRNGKTPTAVVQSEIADRVSFAANVRSKLLFSKSVPIPSIPASAAGTRYRWRFAFHSGPYCKTLAVRMELAQQNNGSATNPYGLLEIKPIVAGAEGSTVARAKVYYGTATSASDLPVNFGGGETTLIDPTADDTLVDLTADTDYVGIFSDVDYARIRSVCVWEVALDPTVANGYPARNFAAGTPIFDEDRGDPATMLRNLWHRGAQQLFNWCSETDATAPSQGLGDLAGSFAQSIGTFTLSAEGTAVTSIPTYQAKSAYETSNNEIVLAWPAHATNDVALLSVVSNNGFVDNEIQTPDGWEFLDRQSTAISGVEGFYKFHTSIYWCRATSASMPDVTIYPSDGGNSTIGGPLPPGYPFLFAAQMTTYRGCVTTGNPYDTFSTAVDPNGSAMEFPVDPGGTTSVPNTLLVALGLHRDGGPVSGWTHDTLTVTERSDEGMLAIADAANAPSGAFTEIDATLTTTTISHQYFVALKP